MNSSIEPSTDLATRSATSELSWGLQDRAVWLEYALTVDQTAYEQGGSLFTAPKAGYEYVFVDVFIENTGERVLPYGPSFFTMRNSQGQITGPIVLVNNMNTTLGSGELEPKGTVTGSIAFEQPIDDQELELRFSPYSDTDEYVRIHLRDRK